MEYYDCPFCNTHKTLRLRNTGNTVGHGMYETAKEYNCFNCGFTLGIKRLGDISEEDINKLKNLYNLIAIKGE